ncbi:outer membrane lipoprotein carrier protein LolA [Marinomonas sp. 5E14-1]|uniref:outer membrane lipoprotein carrier protein LolA n=1 Tax=Marinomonas sp. 5E14-1 TaxID=3153922 RepID=UPI003267521A
MKNTILGIILFLLSLSSFANDLDRLKTVTAAPDKLTGTFTQSKYLAQLDTSLQSTGEFNYLRDTQIIWHTLSPIDSTLELTPNTMLNYQNGIQVNKLDTTTNPIVAVLSDIFFGVMTAQWQILEEYFDVNAEVVGEHWKATLIPLNKNIGSFIHKVTLEGDKYLKQVTLYEPEGNLTHIEFDQLQQK